MAGRPRDLEGQYGIGIAGAAPTIPTARQQTIFARYQRTRQEATQIPAGAVQTSGASSVIDVTQQGWKSS